MGDYPDINLPIQAVQVPMAYQLILEHDEIGNVAIKFAGTATGCAVILHDIISGAMIQHAKHELSGTGIENIPWRIRAERKSAYLLSAWTYLGGDVAGANAGYHQIQAANFIPWVEGVGGRAEYLASGSPNGSTSIQAIISVDRA